MLVNIYGIIIKVILWSNLLKYTFCYINLGFSSKTTFFALLFVIKFKAAVVLHY